MITATPALQLAIVDTNADPQEPPALQGGGQNVNCPNSDGLQSVTLAASTSGYNLPFPAGVTTAALVFIASSTTTDLILTIGGVQQTIPYKQGTFLYGLTASQFSLGTVAGGAIRYWVGG